MNEEHVTDFSDFGTREGPCVVVYRDWNWYEHPQYRSYSCLGCRWLEVNEHGDRYCNHPVLVEKYEVAQYFGENFQYRGKKLIHEETCPVVRMRRAPWLEQPLPDRIPKKDNEYAYHSEEEIFCIPQRYEPVNDYTTCMECYRKPRSVRPLPKGWVWDSRRPDCRGTFCPAHAYLNHKAGGAR